MCGCVNCIVSRFHQASLNAFRHRHVRFLLEASERVVGPDDKAIAVARYERYRNKVLPNGKPLHPKPRDALIDSMCPWEHNDLPKWQCVCGFCGACPEYDVLPEEQGESLDAPKITFAEYT